MPSHLSARGWIDVSVPVRTGMVRWPGDPGVKVERRRSIDRGDPVNQSELLMSAHAGTHIDAPVHFVRSGRSVDEIDLQALIGPARVIEIEDPESIKVSDLKGHRIRKGERILFKTRNSERCWDEDRFFEDYVHITVEAARYLAKTAVRTLGIDYLSVGGYKKGGIQTHVALMKAGVLIIEGLDLSPVGPGRYDLIALPLRLAGSDGSPARVLVKRR